MLTLISPSNKRNIITYRNSKNNIDSDRDSNGNSGNNGDTGGDNDSVNGNFKKGYGTKMIYT